MAEYHEIGHKVQKWCYVMKINFVGKLVRALTSGGNVCYFDDFTENPLERKIFDGHQPFCGNDGSSVAVHILSATSSSFQRKWTSTNWAHKNHTRHQAMDIYKNTNEINVTTEAKKWRCELKTIHWWSEQWSQAKTNDGNYTNNNPKKKRNVVQSKRCHSI